MRKQNGRKRIIDAALLLVFGFAAHPALASIFETCVKSDADLANALDAAQSQTVIAKIVQHKLTVQGTAYDLKNTVWQTTTSGGVQGGSQFLGGYTAGCSSRDIAAGNTLIINSASSANATFYPRGNLTVEGLTFSLHHGLGVGLGSASYLNVPSGSTIEFLRDAFINGNDGYLIIDWDQAANSDSTIRVVDSLFANNTNLDASLSFCALRLESDSGAPEFDVINNTVFNNAGSDVGGACFYGGSTNATFQAFNNIFWGTSGTGSVDLVNDTSLVVLDHNIYNSRAGSPPITLSHNLFSDPTLDPTTYRPIEVPQSNAINSGNNTPPGLLPLSDLDGGARVVGSIVDRGAYESSIDPHPVQIVTTNIDNGGTGVPLQLRQAIHNVNSNGGGTIKFAFTSGSCPHVITVSSALGEFEPLIVDATIDGYLQSADASANSLDPGDNAVICVILEAGTGVGAPARGLVVGSAAPDDASVTIRGIGFSGFSTTGVDLQGGSGHTIVGDHFGGNIGGHAMQPNGFAIRLGNGTNTTHDDAIGSSAIADRNIIGDAVNSGVVIFGGSKHNQVIGNYIGMGWNLGTSSYINRANGARGIHLAGDSNTISGNLIGFNVQAGIVLDSLGAHDNLISGNFIGTTANGNLLGNGSAGIHLIGDSSGTGDAPNDNTIRSNTIGQNSAQGVLVDVGRRNRIRKNLIHANVLLGIDLDVPGVASPQDDDGAPGQPPDYANRGQNFPVLTKASGGIGAGLVIGTLTTTPGDYTVDFYVASTCTNTYREGAVWLGAATVTVPSPMSGDQGVGPISVQITSPEPSAPFSDGTKISATATDSNGNTSEFSACATYSNDGIFANGFETPAL